MENIKKHLIQLINSINNEISNLPNEQQHEIYNSESIPDDKKRMFLKRCYYSANDLLKELNNL